MRRIQPYLLAVLAALKFRGADRDRIQLLDDAGWRGFLSVCDTMHLTIPVGRVLGNDCPEWVRSRIDQNVRDNTQRFVRIRDVYTEIANAFADVKAEHLVLKGFAQSPDFVSDPALRMQSDLDLFSPPDSIALALDALLRIGFETIQGVEHQPTDHLPPMMRKTEWKWRDNCFDPDLPIGVDLHFRFWNDVESRIDMDGLDQFWSRRVERNTPFRFPALSLVDSVGYAAMHVFHHLQLGGLRPYHVYELGNFLHENAENDLFWKEWSNLHRGSLRRVEVIAFRLAAHWFDCRLPEQVKKEISALPNSIHKWFRTYARSPLDALVHPNKDALWLHLSLLESSHQRIAVLCGGLFPVRVPPAKALQHWNWRIYPKFTWYAASRMFFHLYRIPRTIWEGVRWWMAS
jgi:hypothetical protein